jgi:NAD(P)-dependent dehydrogenase (short-subunit alcohol dehydrogenase family)
MADTGTALIVGASRGLGLGLAAEYLRRGWSVVATQRSASPELEQLAAGSHGRLTIENVDVALDDQIEALRRRLDGTTFDLVFVNAGVTGAPDLLQASDEEVNAIMQANTFGPVKLARRFIDRVRERTGVVAFMSTGMGSIGDNTSGGWDVYRASKAAQNILARSLAVTEAPGAGSPSCPSTPAG